MKETNKRIYDMSMKNQDSYPKGKFILENFKDAPDIFFPADIEEQLYLNMAKYMDMDNPVYKSNFNYFCKVLKRK